MRVHDSQAGALSPVNHRGLPQGYHDSQACRKMDVTREHISRILELKEIPLSFQTGFNLVNVAVVSAILESISGLESSQASSTWAQL